MPGYVMVHDEVYVIWFGKEFITVRDECGYFKYKQSQFISLEYKDD